MGLRGILVFKVFRGEVKVEEIPEVYLKGAGYSEDGAESWIGAGGFDTGNLA